MNERAFNKVLNACRIKIKSKFIGQLDLAKVDALPDEVKSKMVSIIVKKRHPVLVNLIPKGFDMAWLECMGYLYQTKGKEFEFVHTCEHTIK